MLQKASAMHMWDSWRACGNDEMCRNLWWDMFAGHCAVSFNGIQLTTGRLSSKITSLLYYAVRLEHWVIKRSTPLFLHQAISSPIWSNLAPGSGVRQKPLSCLGERATARAGSSCAATPCNMWQEGRGLPGAGCLRDKTPHRTRVRREAVEARFQVIVVVEPLCLF